MGPAIAFPWENDLVASSPKQLVVSGDWTIHAAAAFAGFPDFTSTTRVHINHSNRPRRPRPHWHEGHCCLHRHEEKVVLGIGDSQERQAVAIGGPDRLRIFIRARIRVAERLRLE